MSNAISSTGECGDADTSVETSSREVVRLCVFAPPLTTAERISRTAKYVLDPRKYLEDTLGKQVYQDRADLLCISPDYSMDVYGSGDQKTHFEQHIANLLGKDHGLFFITGVQAQLVALKVQCEKAKNPRVAWHISAHLENAEERAFEELYGLKRILLGSDPRSLPSVDEILQVIRLPEDQRPAIVILELPNRVLGCATYSYVDLERISTACRQHAVALHMDGARFWEIEPFYQETASKSYKEVAALFDTVYVSFYKGLGGVTGALLASNSKETINNARMWQRRAGGNPFTLMYETMDCERGFNENIGTFDRKWKKMRDVVTQIQAETSYFKKDGKQVIDFWLKEPNCAQVRTIFNGYTEAELYVARDQVEHKTGIRIFEMLWSKYSLDDKLAADRAGKQPGDQDEYADDRLHEIEWSIKDVTERIDTVTFAKGYMTLCQCLEAAASAEHESSVNTATAS